MYWYVLCHSIVPRSSNKAFLAGRPGSSEVPRNPLTRWDVSSIPAKGIFLTKKLKNKIKMPDGWRTIESLVHKIRLHGRRGKGMAKSFSREKWRHAPQKEGGWEILCDLPPAWPRLVRPTNLMSRMNGKKTHTQRRGVECFHFFFFFCELSRLYYLWVGSRVYIDVFSRTTYIVCVCVFIKLHMTAQSGLAILVILCHSRWSSQGGINDTCYENLWSNATEGCVCVFIKLHITAQSGPAILVILCHSHWSSQGGNVPAGATQEEGHTWFLHRPSAVPALIFLARIQPFLSLVYHEVEFVYWRFNHSPLTWWAFFSCYERSE